MGRALVLATFFSLVQGTASVQDASILHIKISLVDASGNATPVPRHALLISDNPSSAPPRRIVTGPDGTANVRLRPGNYTVESDQPVAFQGKAYQWTEIVDVVAGRDGVLELTAGNAEVEATNAESMAPGATSPAPPAGADASSLLMQWQDSVVAIWTSTTHASGFVIDAKGLIATSQRVLGTATSVEVQLTSALKVAGKVLAADSAKDVAVVWIDPVALGSIRPVPLGCASARAPVAGGQEVFTLGTPLRGEKEVTSGMVTRVEPHVIVSDLAIATGSAGGPVFAADGAAVGITSGIDERNGSRRGSAGVAPVADACEAVESAVQKMKGAAPPGSAHLPVEPVQRFRADALDAAARRRAGSLSPYQVSSSSFDVAFITPELAYAAQSQSEESDRRGRGGAQRTSVTEQSAIQPLANFSNWSEYVADFPPVLLVRVTPRLVEGFWKKVARGAAQTQGVALPPLKSFKPGFSRMRAFCGDAEVTPIHPFKIEQQLTDTEAIHEGLYVFDPGALGPQCATVKVVLYSEKEPDQGETRVVDPKVIAQIWEDFAPLRDQPGNRTVKHVPCP